MNIGVLSIQGGIIEHINNIESIGCRAIKIKKLEDLNDIQGLIIPGGESTAISKVLRDRNMLIPIKEKILSGLPTWGTCAGMILLAKEIESCPNAHLGVIDIKVKRNAYGSQIDSFEHVCTIKEISNDPIPLVFIRAPYITSVGANVKVLLKLNENIVAARENNILVTSFHPELTNNLEFHRYFVSMCNEYN